MDRKCTTIVCLVAMVVVLGDLGSYGVILSMICLAVPIYYDIDRVLPYNSRNREMQSFWDRKKYLYVGEMSFRMAFNLAFGVYTVGLLGSTLAKIRRVKSHTKYKILLCGREEDVKSFRIATEGDRFYEFGKELLYPVQQDSGDYFLFLADGNFAVVPEKEAIIEFNKEGGFKL